MKTEKEIYPSPFILERADPFITKANDGFYYFTATYPMSSETSSEGYDRIILRRAKKINELTKAEEKVIFLAGKDTKTHRFIWAPELHQIQGRWYIYYAGSCDNENPWDFDCNVLECQSDDPYAGPWKECGKFQTVDGDDFSFTGFSLDMTCFSYDNRSYVVWAQHDAQQISCLYIAELDRQQPYKLLTKPVLISQPDYPWEKERHEVNEGPSVLFHEDKIFIFFSASGTGPEYCVGALESTVNSDFLRPLSWHKLSQPLLTSQNLTDEYGPGHNSFTKDSQENDLIVYHARSRECYEGKCAYAGNYPLYDPCRHTQIKNITWNREGYPVIN